MILGGSNICVAPDNENGMVSIHLVVHLGGPFVLGAEVLKKLLPPPQISHCKNFITMSCEVSMGISSFLHMFFCSRNYFHSTVNGFGCVCVPWCGQNG